jgi:hypothetical protein
MKNKWILFLENFQEEISKISKKSEETELNYSTNFIIRF